MESWKHKRLFFPCFWSELIFKNIFHVYLENYVIILAKLRKIGIETSNKVDQILLLPYWALAQQFARAYKVQGLEKKIISFNSYVP
jgi:hypothetical protein